MANAYDQVRYPSLPIAHTHPAALGAFLPLFGRAFVPMDGARVLEIGCGSGSNLLSMALGAPNTEFVGVDLARSPIEAGREVVRATGLTNVSLHVGDIARMDASWGSFDYIIAHGVYSWVPLDVRAALMTLIGKLLSPNGLAFVSYNALPGSRIRQALRDMLLYVAGDVDDAAEKLARARAFMAEQVESWSQDDADERAVRMEAIRMLKRAPEVLFHDELGEFFAPALMSDVCASASAAGLEYLCDAAPMQCKESFFPSEEFEIARKHAGADWVRFEQLADFKSMRAFRNSLFCRPGGIDRSRGAARLRDLWACADLKAGVPEAGSADRYVFLVNGGARLATNDPRLGAFLDRLASAYPASVKLDDIEAGSDLADYVLRLFVNQVVRLRVAPFSVSTASGERPLANPLARRQAASGDKEISTMHHTVVRIDDEQILAFLPLLDGARARGELIAHVAAARSLSAEAAAAWVSAALPALSRSGIMMA